MIYISNCIETFDDVLVEQTFDALSLIKIEFSGALISESVTYNYLESNQLNLFRNLGVVEFVSY